MAWLSNLLSCSVGLLDIELLRLLWSEHSRNFVEAGSQTYAGLMA